MTQGPRGRQGKWTPSQLERRLKSLQRDGFTPEEAFDLASWNQNLTHRVIDGMRRDRKALVTSLRRQGLDQEAIDQRLRRRYIDLGISGQYENEEWYFSRVGAA